MCKHKPNKARVTITIKLCLCCHSPWLLTLLYGGKHPFTLEMGDATGGQYRAVQGSTGQYSAVQCSTVKFSIVRCNAE